MAEQILRIRTTLDAAGVTQLETRLSGLDKIATQTGKQLASALKPIETKPNTAGLKSIETGLGAVESKAKQTHTPLAATLKAVAGTADTKGLHTISTALSSTEKAASTALKVIAAPLKALGGHANTQGLKEIDSGFKDVEKQAEASSSRIKGFLSSVASTAAGIAIADVGMKLAGGLTDAVKSANEFDDSLLKTQALAGASKDEIDGYRKGILDLTTQIPVSANQMADALFFVKSAGFAGADALNILKISGEASASGLGEMKVVADAVTSTLNAYKLSGKDAAHVTDVLTAAVTDGKASADSFAPALGRVLPLAAQMGVSFEQVTASMATMTRTGLNTDEAATALRGTLAAFEKPGKQAQAALASIGLTADEVRQSIREKGLLATLKDLNDRTEGNDETLAMIIPNIRALTGVLSTAGSQADAYTQILDDMNKAHGNTENAFKTMQESATFQWGLMRNNMQKILIEIGSKVLPIMSQALSGLNEAVGAFVAGDWSKAGGLLVNGLLSGIKALANVGQQFGTWIAEELTAGFQWLGTRDWGQTGQVLVRWMGTALHTITGIAEMFGTWLGDQFGAGFAWLGSRDWGATAQAIGGALQTALGSIGGVAQAVGDWLGDQISKVDWSKVWSNIKTEGINLFGSGFGNVTDTLESITTGIRQNVIPAIRDFVKELQVDVAPAVFTATKDVLAWLGDHKEVVVGATAGIAALGVAYGAYSIAVGIATGLTTAFGAVLAVVTSPVTLIIAAFVALGIGIAELVVHWKDITAAVPALGVAFDAVKQAIGAFAAWITSDFLPAIVGMVTWVRDHWSEIVQHFSGPIEIVKSAVVGAFDFIKDEIHIALDLIVGIVKVATDILSGNWSQAWNDIKALVVNIWNDIKTLISDQLTAIEGILDGAWKIIKDVAGAAWDGIKALASELWSGIKTAITDEIHNAEHDLSTIWDAIKSAASIAWDLVKTAANDVWNAIKTAVTTPITEAKNDLGGLWSDIGSAAEKAWNWIKQKFIDGKNDMIDALEAPFKWIKDSVPTIIKDGMNAGIDVFNGFMGGIDDFIIGVQKVINWVTDHLGLGKLLPESGLNIRIPKLAGGTNAWAGGLAIVGEVGPELVYLPKGAAVLPAHETQAVMKGQTLTDVSGRQRTVVGQPKEGIDIPGFFLGLDPGKVIDAVRGAWNAVHDFVNEWVAKGAEALVNTAMDTIGVKTPGSGMGILGDIGKGVFTSIKDGVVTGVKELLGLADKARPQVSAVAGGAVAADIAAWVNAHAAGLGIDPHELAVALIAVSAYENGLQTTPEAGGGGGQGPFQLTGPTLAAALAGGYIPTSASSTLSFFLSNGDLRAGIAAYLAAGGGSAGGHAMELAMERPSASADAARVAAGDWDRAWALAQAIVAGANATQNPIGAAGNWVRPLGGGYTIKQGFGPADPSVAGMEPGGFHQGIDMASFRGDPILAALAGVVRAAGDGAYGGLGIAVVLDHGQGLNTIYGHMLDTAVGAGQVVNAGDLLGHEDSTGASTGDHLHFQVNVNGTPVDPRNFVALARGGMITNAVTALVGEEGPEIVTLPAGAAVYPADITSWLRGGQRAFQEGTDPGYPLTPLNTSRRLPPAVYPPPLTGNAVQDAINNAQYYTGGASTWPDGTIRGADGSIWGRMPANTPGLGAPPSPGTPGLQPGQYGYSPPSPSSSSDPSQWQWDPRTGQYVLASPSTSTPTIPSSSVPSSTTQPSTPVPVNITHVGGSPIPAGKGGSGGSPESWLVQSKLSMPSWTMGLGGATGAGGTSSGASSEEKPDKHKPWTLPWVTGRLKGAELVQAMASGGLITEPILGVGLHTGRTFSLGEAGIEAVIPLSSRTGAQALATTLPSDIHAGEQKPAHTDVLSQFIVNDTVLAEMAYSGMNKDIRMRGRFP